MLHTETLEPATLEILRKLMQIPELSDFLLVGGTALSLHYGHRLSIDIDLFATQEFDNDNIIKKLSDNFKGFTYQKGNYPIGIFGFIDDVKIDLVKNHQHPLIGTTTYTDGIRIISIPDIIAMKVNAIFKRAVKKDFWDIAELLQHYSINDFVNFYQNKYPGQQLLISIPQAMIYFEEAEESDDPISLKGQTWNSVKSVIQQKVGDYLK